MKVAVIGATGLVGSKMLQVLAARNFPVTEIILVKKYPLKVMNIP